MYHLRLVFVILSMFCVLVYMSLLLVGRQRQFVAANPAITTPRNDEPMVLGQHNERASRGSPSPPSSSEIDIIGKWQQGQIKEFCKKHHAEKKELDLVNHFILFNDEKKLAMCVIPKIGCTNGKIFMYKLSKSLPAPVSASNSSDYKNKMFVMASKKSSFLNKSLTKSDRQHILNTYWKFTILRNPLERLVSAYRNKLLTPIGTNHYWDPFKKQILYKYGKDRVDAWRREHHFSEVGLTVDFQSYVRWIVDSPNETLEPHFRPMIHFIHPCSVTYDFYGKFKHYSSDLHKVMDKFSIPRELFEDEGYYGSGQNTTALLASYYSTLSPKLKEALFEDFYTELDFYYHLFPEEKESHVRLLDFATEVL